jgi:hypothetical protein
VKKQAEVVRPSAERPSSVRVLGKPVSMLYVDEGDLDFANNGVFMHDKLKIVIKNGLPIALEQEIVLHELTHAVSEFMNIDMTEHQVTALAAGMVQMFRDNTELLSYLGQE